MSDLTDLSGSFALPLGRLIQAKVSASNDIGASTYSTLNTVGEHAQTVPLRPTAPERNSGTTTTTLIVDYAFDTTEQVDDVSLKNGGSAILTLNL